MMLLKSPNPSMEMTAASSKGDAKKALARWARWCSYWQPMRYWALPLSQTGVRSFGLPLIM